MTVSAKIIADTTSKVGVRLVTMELRYPRFIHSEIMTHRMFSKNAASSRAIPGKSMRAAIRRDPAMPPVWGSNKAGMQSGAEIGARAVKAARCLWLALLWVALGVSWLLERIGCHKQIFNRITEPWSHISVVFTGVDRAYENLFALRTHKDAEPTFQALALVMADVYYFGEVPDEFDRGGNGAFHLPYIRDSDIATLDAAWGLDVIQQVFGLDEPEFDPRFEDAKLAVMVSAARCARVSYRADRVEEGSESTYTVDDVIKDVKLYKRLVGSVPMHASPVEHQAFMGEAGPGEGGNFTDRAGFVQFRKTLKGECASFSWQEAKRALKAAGHVHPVRD